MKTVGWLGITVCLLVVAPGSGAAADGVILPAAVEVLQGELVEVRVAGGDLDAVQGRLDNEKIYFHAEGNGGFSAIVGADVQAKPGEKRFVLQLTHRGGARSEREIPLKIRAKKFRTESFKVAPGFDHMTPEALDAIREERQAFARAFAASVPERLWEAPFLRPVPHPASPTFGARRIINGIPRAPHSGTDLSSPAGTEVLASNHGRVVLVGHFFFAGGSVVLDHGAGLLTMYFHLSELRVEEGARVKKGDVVALSGATGRVTGAHLHWGARLANARIDPLELLSKVSAGSDSMREAQSLNRRTEK